MDIFSSAMTRRKRSSGDSGPRKRRPRQAFPQAQFYNLDDVELAQAVCQVVKDLVCQVADEPYGDLTQKRPSFFNVIRKFVKDSVQAHEDNAVADYLYRSFKKTRWVRRYDKVLIEPREETPYGMDLVWGIVLSETEKADRREKARVYSAEKTARLRQQRMVEALEAAQSWEQRKQETLLELETKNRKRAFEAEQAQHGLLLDGDLSVDSASSEEEENRKKPMSRQINPFVFEADPPQLSANLNLSPSPRSDDSDWAVISQPKRSIPVKGPPIENYPIFLPRGARGRGRPAKIANPIVRSAVDATGPSSSRVHSEMHPNVSLIAAGQSKRIEPEFEFSSVGWCKNKEKYVIKDSLPPRNTRLRGRGARGRRGGLAREASEDKNLRLIMEAWDADAEEFQQHLLAESIESSGDNASQESNNDISNTINEVLKKVNEMRELGEEGKGRKRARLSEKRDEEKAMKVSGSSTRTLNEPSTCIGVKRAKTDVDIIDSEDGEQESPSLGIVSPIRDSSVEEPPIPNLKAIAVEAASQSSSSEIFIIN